MKAMHREKLGCIAMWYPLFKNIHCNYMLFLKANVVLLPFKKLMGRAWLFKTRIVKNIFF